MKHFIWLLLVSSICFAQIKAKTEDGKVVLLYPDSTWAYQQDSLATPAKIDTGGCESLVQSYKDKMTGDTGVAAKRRIIVATQDRKKGFAIQLMLTHSDGVLIFSVTVVGGGCVKENPEIMFLFRDGERMSIRGHNKFNCDAYATVYFNGSFGGAKQLHKLMTKEIETMRVKTHDSFVQMDFESSQSKQVIQVLNCLLPLKP